ncbi:unnamed protein product [Rangifer tarandus platyrhynchus]|uniref:Uncharacterized protein n=2 Tax=Rangifer tarandus platyrhynchus TaxID=3082113 RepID=A0ABN8XQ45_RANTA|nr:unnamed protein product [Rangifer tarandus platyrhynchus]CAI9691224.1 unnamed protein product [Rangifer tarandus platyrhynchus]
MGRLTSDGIPRELEEGKGSLAPSRVPLALRSLPPAFGAPILPASLQPSPTPGYLLRDSGQRERDRSGRAAAAHRAEFSIGWGPSEMW